MLQYVKKWLLQLKRQQNTVISDKTEYINALVSYQLLIIDDLGVERNSEYALGIIFNL